MSEQVGITLLDRHGRLGPVADAATAVGVPVEGRYDRMDEVGHCPDCLVVSDGPETDDRPEANGLRLVESARERFECPVVVYTHREGYEAIRAPLDAGATDVVRVPDYRPHLIARRVADAAGYGGSFQSSGEQIASLLRNYPHTLFLKDDVGRFENVTAHTANNYGFTRQQLIGMSDYELFSTDHADELWEAEQEVIRRGEPQINAVEEYVDQHGEQRWVSTTRVPRRTVDGEIIGIVGGTQDVTPAKQQESLMEALHEASRRLTRATARPEIATVTTEIAAEIGHLPAVQVALAAADGTLEPVQVGEHDGDTADNGRMATDRSIFQQYETAFRRAYATGTTQYVDTDGRRTETADVVSPVFEGEFESDEVAIAIPLGEHGVLGVAAPQGTVDDFTDRLAHVLASNVVAAFDRAERERELERKNRRLEEFTTLGAHELRNRLQVAFANVARARTEGESQPLNGAETALERIDRLLTQLLQLAKTGTIPSATDCVDLRDATRRAWAEIDTPPEATLSLPPDVSLRANREALLEILGALLENSVEHGLHDDSEPVDEELTIDVSTTESGFYVADDGIGIPAERRSRLFDLEYVDSDTGYGLYIASVLVEAHDWEITAAESDSGGARFDISGVERP